MIYIITLFVTWFVTGVTKFLVNCVVHKRLALDLIGYGGMPSNHSAIVMSMVMLIALQNGMSHPAFGAAATLAFIVMLDANGLRNKVAKQAKAINKLTKSQAGDENFLRERVGHSRLQILCGACVGVVVAMGIDFAQGLI